MTARSFIEEKFGGILRGHNYRADCTECHKKQVLSWSQLHPHAFKCFSCGYSGNVFSLGFRDENGKKPETSPEFDPMTIEGFKARRRKKGGSMAQNRHRLSDRVVGEFDLKVRKVNGAGDRPSFQIPFLNSEGQTVKYLTTYQKSWLSPASKYKPKDFWLNIHRLASNKNPKVIYVLAGEWDLFAFWEHTGVHGISPANGEMSRPPIEETDIFAGKLVVFLYDNDASGRKGAKSVASFILRHQKNVRIKSVNMATLGCPAGEDLDWYFQNGGTKERLLDQIKGTPDITDTTPDDVFKLIHGLPARGIARPENPVSELPGDTLEVIWRAGALPENQKARVFEQLAMEEGVRPDQVRRIAQRAKYFENELNTLIFHAFDSYLRHIAQEINIRAEQPAGAERLAHRNYYFYDGGVYRFINEEFARRMIDRIAREVCPPTNRLMLARIRKQLEEDFMNLCDNLPGARFDESTDIINFRNGLYDLREVLLKAHTPDHLSTFQLAIDYNQGSPCPWFMQALETWFEDQDVRDEFLKVCYYAITGNRGQHIAAFFYGEGGDGKGEAVKILKSLIGEERTSAISLEDLNNQFMPAGLFGKWLNIADEVNRKTHINDGKFKKVTGGSTMTADVKNKQPITFESKAFWVVITNSLFSSSDNSRGFTRRLKFIVFRQVPPGKKVDNFFQTKLKPELSGIAEYILSEGKRLYEADGFCETNAEKRIKDEFSRGHSVNAFWQDLINEYVEGVSEINLARSAPEGKYTGWQYIDIHQFYDKYKEHCKASGSSPSNYQNFAMDSRNTIERMLNNPDVAPGKGSTPVRVLRAIMRIRPDMLKPAVATRVLAINADVLTLLKPAPMPQKRPEGDGESAFLSAWINTPPA